MKAITEDDEVTRVFVIRLKHVRDMDATSVTALRQLYDYLRKNGKYLVVASIPPQVLQVLENARLIEYIGKENLYLFDETTLIAQVSLLSSVPGHSQAKRYPKHRFRQMIRRRQLRNLLSIVSAPDRTSGNHRHGFCRGGRPSARYFLA